MAVLGSLIPCAFAHSLHALECPKEVWRELFFCGRIRARHLNRNSESMCLDWSASDMAEENALRSDRDSSPDLREMWKYGFPKSSVWSGDDFEGKRSEDTPSEQYCEHNVDNLAIEVVGQKWSSEVISLFLKDWGVGRVALSCPLVHGPFVPRNVGCVQEELRLSGLSSLRVFRVLGKMEQVFRCPSSLFQC